MYCVTKAIGMLLAVWYDIPFSWEKRRKENVFNPKGYFCGQIMGNGAYEHNAV